MMKRPNEGDSNNDHARAKKVMRTEDIRSFVHPHHPSSTELDGKIIASRFRAFDRPTASSTTTKTTSTKANATTKTTHSADTFPEKLAETLRSDVHQDAIWWNPEGTVFCLRPKQFTEKVLDRVFQGTKLESFQRKMKRWGFERCFDTSFPRGALVYHHPLFQRDQPELMSQMSAGMNKYARQGGNEGDETSRMLTGNNCSIAGLGSNLPPPHNPVVDSGRLGGILHQQRHMQILAAQRLGAATTLQASQAAVRNLCLQTLGHPAIMPSLQQQPYLTPSAISHPASNTMGLVGRQVVPPPDTIDLSQLSILRLLQLRDMLSRGSR